MKKNKFIIPDKYIPYFKNKYFLTSLGFIIWLSFFDKNDFITTWRYHQKLQSLKNEKKYFEEEEKKNTVSLNNLLSDPAYLEKYAREEYFMKRDNEDIFVIVDERKNKDE